MDGIHEFLDLVRKQSLARGRMRGLFHVAIGRRISRADGTLLSAGLTWRQLAAELKNLRFDKDLVSELGVDPDTLSPRDRERFWYAAIGLARVDTAEARVQADQLTAAVAQLGYVIGPPPTAMPGDIAPLPSGDDAGKKRKKK